MTSPAGPAALAAEGPAERQALIFGQHIRYVEAGSGPTLVLVHGLGGSSRDWQKVISPLARRYHVVALDQVGFGRSDKPLMDYRAETLADFLDEFLRDRKIPRATVVGNSLGGWVAALLAIEHPERVSHLVLLDSAGLSGLTDYLGSERLMALRAATVGDQRLLNPLLFADMGDLNAPDNLRKAYTDRIAAGDGYAVSKIMDAIDRKEDMLDTRLGAIRMPTLVLWGRQDRLIPLKLGEDFQRGITGSRLAVLDHCGHAPELECPQAFERALEDFLAQ